MGDFFPDYRIARCYFSLNQRTFITDIKYRIICPEIFEGVYTDFDGHDRLT